MFNDIAFANEVLIALLGDLASDVINTKPTSSTYREVGISEFNLETVKKQRHIRDVKVFLK